MSQRVAIETLSYDLVYRKVGKVLVAAGWVSGKGMKLRRPQDLVVGLGHREFRISSPPQQTAWNCYGRNEETTSGKEPSSVSITVITPHREAQEEPLGGVELHVLGEGVTTGPNSVNAHRDA